MWVCTTGLQQSNNGTGTAGKRLLVAKNGARRRRRRSDSDGVGSARNGGEVCVVYCAMALVCSELGAEERENALRLFRWWWWSKVLLVRFMNAVTDKPDWTKKVGCPFHSSSLLPDAIPRCPSGV